MALAADPKPFRITDGPFTDRWPTVSPLGDKIFFVSNRANREPGATTYLMSVNIDKRTGRPTAPPRQVSTDSASFIGPYAISPDGQTLAYTSPGKPATVKVMPTAGGNARVIADKISFGGLMIAFSEDGKRVIYQDSGAKILKAVSLAGGSPTVLTRAIGPTTLAPYPRRDDAYLAVVESGGSVVTELRQLDGRVLSGTSHPRRLGTGAQPTALRADGRGWIGAQMERHYWMSRFTTNANAADEIIPAQPHWMFGVADDGTVVGDRMANGRVIVGSFAPGARTPKEVTLGAEITEIAGLLSGGSHMLAWGGVAESPVIFGPMLSNQGERPRSAYVVDRATGRTRRLSTTAIRGCCPRNWGGDEDVNAMLELRGANVDIKRIDGTGALQLVRTVPLAELKRMRDLTVQNDRVAYVMEEGDSAGVTRAGVYLATGMSPARRVDSVSFDGDPVLGFSADGRRLAVAFSDARNRNKPTARIYDIAPDNGVTARVDLDAGPPGSDYYETLTWLPDGSAILMMRDIMPSGSNFVVRRPLDRSLPAEILRKDDPGVGAFMLDPKTKQVLFTRGATSGASLWTAELQPRK
jgi:dipeptidyl aminopeptidase/acylaminoacyl peptidase